jgi:hypothetical protein
MRAPNVVMTAALSTLLAYACVGCPHPHVVVPPDGAQDASTPDVPPNLPDAAPDAPTAILDGAQPPDAYPVCRAACRNLEAIGCPEAASAPGGESCYDVCAHAESTHKFDFRPGCLSLAKDLAAARACGTVRCKTTGAPADAGVAPLMVPVHGT